MQRRARRSGTTYILVMGAAAIISTVGLSGLMVARVQQRGSADSNDAVHAVLLAQSALELGITRINLDPNWRTTYTNNVEIPSIDFGRGRMSFKLVDDALGMTSGDGSLTNNTYDPVRLYGYGRVGNAVRVLSVRLVGSTPIDALRCCMVAKDAGNNVEALTASAPIAANGNFKVDNRLTANLEATTVTYGGGGVVDGNITLLAPAKTMPDSTVFDAYKRLATTITVGGGNWAPATPLLSATTNPFGATNAQGIYYVSISASKKAQIKIDHIKGTLLIDCADKANVEVSYPVYWEPHTTDLPILLIRHLTTGATDDILKPTPGFVTEGGQTYASELHGLIYITCPSGAGNINAKVGDGATVSGTIITDQDIKCDGPPGAYCNWLSNLYLNPPVGFTTGPLMKIAIGTARWEAGP